MYLDGVEQRSTEQFKCLSSRPVLKQEEFPILPEEFVSSPEKEVSPGGKCC